MERQASFERREAERKAKLQGRLDRIHADGEAAQQRIKAQCQAQVPVESIEARVERRAMRLFTLAEWGFGLQVVAVVLPFVAVVVVVIILLAVFVW